MTAVDEIKSRLDIVDLVSETVELRKAGKNYTGFCPFHPNTRTPAFVVFPDSQNWHCFGQCNEGGDIFNFVMKKEGWDFPEALNFLADRAGVKLEPLTRQAQEEKDENDRLRDLLEEAVTFFRHQLLETPGGKPALDYLKDRGLADGTIETFGLGYAPDSWDSLASYFNEKGHTEEDLLAAGLVSPRDSGGVFDRFRKRILFPIRDGGGRMAGFGARGLDPEDLPKYLNSPQTAIFDKGNLLYGLDRARKSIRKIDQAVIVEGYMDVIALHQAGFENVVSPMGTALTESQLRQLKRLTHRIVLALDADAAGARATLRGLEVARQAMDREYDPTIDPRGLLRHEARLQADIRVTTLPEGMDPDELVNESPQAWEETLKVARPIVVHVMETLSEGRDIGDAKVKSEIAGQVLPLIEDIPSPIERDTYRQRLARLLQIDERTLIQGNQGPAPPRPTRRRRPPPPAEPRPESTAASALLTNTGYRQEAYSLGVLMRQPDLIYRVDRSLQEAGLRRLSVKDFIHSDHQVIFRLIYESLEQNLAEPVDFVLANLPLSLMEHADMILAETKDLTLSDSRVLRDLLRTILDLRRRHLSQSIDQLRYLMETSQEEGDSKVRQYQEVLAQHILTRSLIDQAAKGQTH
ncbi:MAG: DNA primase [Anaerolineales bacterium]|nr:DNA primase [Anaerolineales bacterium]